jgi:GNAT superfamily N-acetyltransferase
VADRPAQRARAVDDLVLRPATPADEPAILELALHTLHWGSEPRWRELYRWKHDRNAFGASPRWVAVDGDVVVGFRVFLRWEWVRPGPTPAGNPPEVVRSVRAVDTATHPDHQGRGIFTRLTKAALSDLEDDGVGFVFNTPNDQSRPGYLKMGWQVVGRPPVMAVPSGPAGLGRLARARTAAELWSEASHVGAPAPELLETASAEALVDTLPAATALETHRSIDYLRWRYGFGELHYRALALGRDPAEGLAIFRVRRRGSAREATVVELLVPAGPGRGRVLRQLLRRVVRRSSADYAIVGHQRSLLATPAAPLPNQGPILTWRSVCEQEAPSLSGWRLGMGELELF